MNGVTGIATSALKAFGASQQVTSNNIANVQTDGFNASRADFQEQVYSGVSVAVSGTQDSVDISREAVNLLSNADGFKVSLNVLKTADEMTKEILSIKE